VAQIIALVDIQPPASRADFSDVYEITELMDTDLHQIIRSNQPLTDEHFRYFMYQVRARAVPLARPDTRLGSPPPSARWYWRVFHVVICRLMYIWWPLA
jgi:hypothetical protein